MVVHNVIQDILRKIIIILVLIVMIFLEVNVCFVKIFMVVDNVKMDIIDNTMHKMIYGIVYNQKWLQLVQFCCFFIKFYFIFQSYKQSMTNKIK